MRKLFSFAAFAAAALAFTACQKTNEGNAPVLDGNTYAGVTAKIAGPGLRAVTDAQNLVPGVEGEDVVKDGYVFFKDFAGQPVDLNEVSGKYTSDPFKAEAGNNVALTLLINKPTNLALIPNDFTSDKKVGLKDLPSLIATEGFTMTGVTSKKVNITEGVTKEQVEAGSNEAANNFDLGNVERVVAKAQAYLNDADLVNGEGLTKYGSLKTDFKWSLAGSAKESYLFADKAGASNQMDEATQLYKDFESAVHKVAVGADIETLKESLQKVSDTYTDAKLTSNFEAKTLAKKVGTDKSEAAAKSVFFFENSCETHVATAAETYPFKRFAYYKVYASLTPNAGKKVEGDALVAATEADYTERTYDVVISKELRDKLVNEGDATGTKWDASKFEEVKDGEGTLTHYTLSITDEKGTFYIGSDNVMYRGLDAAAKAGLTSVRKFKGGKMVYLTVVNRQKNDKDITINADTRRNNIYQITVDGFDALGLNYDPIDPKDPNIPEPGDNPFEPEPDPDKEIDEAETWMRVTANILQWNHVTRHETLK